MPRVSSFLAAALLAGASATHAMGAPDCAPEDLAPVQDWLSHHPWKAGSVANDAMVTAACKLWPYDKSVLIVVAAYAQDKERDKNLVVALVDTKTMTVKSTFQGTIVEDASWSVLPGSVHLDTARYDLAPGARAFGIDILSDPVDDAVVRGGVTGTRTLFIQQGTHLRLVMDGFVLTTSTKSAEGITKTSSKIAIDTAHTTSGFDDLLVTRSVDPANTGVGRERTTLKFDGQRYAGSGPGWMRHQVSEQQ